jgi:hypothetical protein
MLAWHEGRLSAKRRRVRLTPFHEVEDKLLRLALLRTFSSLSFSNLLHRAF